jgi:hypothetical protein
MIIRKYKFLTLPFILLFTATPITPLLGSECSSPRDYIRRVYSQDKKTISYEIDKSISYREATVEFYGRRGHVLRKNTIIKLDHPKGQFTIPDSVFITPPQLWFNFVVIDEDGCRIWGLVNELPISETGNIIGIGNPSGEGGAFYLREIKERNSSE